MFIIIVHFSIGTNDFRVSYVTSQYLFILNKYSWRLDPIKLEVLGINFPSPMNAFNFILYHLQLINHFNLYYWITKYLYHTVAKIRLNSVKFKMINYTYWYLNHLYRLFKISSVIRTFWYILRLSQSINKWIHYCFTLLDLKLHVTRFFQSI